MKRISLKTAILIMLSIQMISCYQFKEASCAEAAEGVRADACNIIISEFSKNEYKFYLQGTIPGTHKKSIFKRINYTWGYWFVDKISVGDTIVKNKGELKFYIHKKDTVLVFPFECDGKVFK